jgi:enoyl-CoA hydratase
MTRREAPGKTPPGETVRIEMRDGTAIVSLDRPPANAIDLAFAADLERAMEDVERRSGARAVVLTGSGSFFSAGLDLKVVPSYDPPMQRRLVTAFNRLVTRLYGMPVPLVAALNGHTVAGGLVLALACDLRIAAAGPFTFGLTEARVGIPFPFAAITVIKAELGASAARALVLRGAKSGPEAMLACGAIDEVRPPEDLLARALEAARDAARMPAGSYVRIKDQLRGEALRRMREAIANDSDPALQSWLTPETATAAARILGGRDGS